MPYILGIDVGVASLGTAVVYTDAEGNVSQDNSPMLYSRIFPTVTGSKTTIEILAKGKDKAKDGNNFIRRTHRLQRRQIDRRRRRAAKLFHLLQNAGLLPAGTSQTALQRDSIIKNLDNELLDKYLPKNENGRRVMLPELTAHGIANRNVPYILRALALKRELEPFEFGRALFHLVQRRGFKSNRKVKENLSDDEVKETGNVNPSIEALRDKMGGLTLGQFFASYNPDKSGRLIRNRKIDKNEKRTALAKIFPPHYTARDLYSDEFNKIWESQWSFHPQRPHPVLTYLLRREVYRTIFHQRRLKSQKGKIGYCELEPKEKKRRRAPVACLEFQRFRYWQKINDIRVSLPNQPERSLTLDEKRKLAAVLEDGTLIKRVTEKHDFEVAEHKRIAEAESLRTGKEVKPKNTDGLWLFFWREVASFFHWEKADKKIENLFNLEKQKDIIISNKTAIEIRQVYPGWDALPEDRKTKLVEILMEDSPEKRIAKRIIKEFALDEEVAKKLSNVSLASGYASYSRIALTKLLHAMQSGQTLYEALELHYPDRNNPKDIMPLLPPVKKILPHIANPSVMRSLTELRKVVNAIIRQHNGEKPICIRVELARILKVGRKKRAAAHEKMIENRDKRKKAKDKLKNSDVWQERYGDEEPTRMDVNKFMLWEECKNIDPYSGDTISITDLFGTNPKFEVEHIYPKSLTGDSSFSNLTLCRKDYNLRKGNRVPKQAFGNTDEYTAMLKRVKRFKNKEKTKRFEAENVPDDFQKRMLNDTSYTATAAVKFLATLYGGTVEKGVGTDGKGKRRIEVVPGQATARLRRLWGLNGILGPNAIKDPEIEAEDVKNPRAPKFRADHRHHPIDAFVIASCSPKVIKQWAAEEEEWESHRRQGREKYWMNLLPPYGEDTYHIVKAAVAQIIVSHRQDHRVSGKLHEETLLSHNDDKGTKREIPANDRSAIKRRVKNSENHHVAVYDDGQGKKGETKWDIKVVSLFAANQRKLERTQNYC